MDLYQKISVLGPSAKYDTCGPKDFGKTTNIPGVYHAKVGGKRVCRLFKVLQSNVCRNNCFYCAFRRDRDCKRVTASSDEMASAFYSAYERRLVDGFFLSSGVVNNSDATMTKMLDTAHILRNNYNYRGYLHLKIMPGTSEECIREAVSVSNRVSVNMESATEAGLAQLSPDKQLKSELFSTLAKTKSEIEKFKKKNKRAPSLTTQFVVGAGEEKDRDLVTMTNLLYKRFGLSRVFYSAFRPVSGTPLEHKPAESVTREHRLYQSDFLMRFYKFDVGEIFFTKEGDLDTDKDPKTLWAENNPAFFPININKACYEDLLRIPGVGPVSARKIIREREFFPIWTLQRFAGMGIQTEKIVDYICY